MQQHRIKFGNEIIPFTLEYRKRKTLEISVYPDMSVRVVAPLDRSYEEIEDKIRKRGSWIIEQRYFFALFLPKQPEKRYVSGESFYYLGKQYRLKIVSSEQDRVSLTRGIILVHTKDKTRSAQINPTFSLSGVKRGL